MTADRPSSLAQRARDVAARARAPYSGYRVGAAVLGRSGDIAVGCNVESASYGLSCCAERVALFTSVAQGLAPLHIAVAAIDAHDEISAGRMPCGACLQIMNDLMGPNGIVEVDGVGEFRVADLLPDPFTLPTGA